MNGSPRPSRPPDASLSTGKGPVSPSSSALRAASTSNDPGAPLIPFRLIDAPSQRFYLAAVYVALWCWRLYDFSLLLNEDADSVWLFLKWTAIDGIFIHTVPGMRIPWLEWSGVTTTVLFLAHGLLNSILMFRIPIPYDAWLVGLAKILYDRELAVSERRVKPASILHNASLILGKQTVHILPEGSAMLNPDRRPFCLDSSITTVKLPIRINQTEPILIEILRVDLESNENHTMTISAKQARALKKQADKDYSKSDVATPRYLQIPIKHTGLYRLQKVVDVSNLEVQRRLSDTLVVGCPRAAVKATHNDKCKGELSDFSFEVYGTPPLKIKYSRVVNREDKGFSFQSIQPESLVSPLIGERQSGALVTNDNADASWARPQRIQVPLNESLSTLGQWGYTIDEVHDAIGNVANYTLRNDDGDHVASKQGSIEQTFSVHERPSVHLDYRDSQCLLKVAKGRTTQLPVSIEALRRGKAEWPYNISYRFTPIDDVQANGEHSPEAKVEEVTVGSPQDLPKVHKPGLYTLGSVSSRFCSGMVLEPTSCLLVNAPEPDLTIASENIYDKCAGNAIGLHVDLDLTGTPPFEVHYEVFDKTSKRAQPNSVRVDGLRHQLDFRPREAGHYVYRFKSISDSVYTSQSLLSRNLVLEQDVKPPASAHFTESKHRKRACIEEPVSFDVRLQGEGPWTLEYELVHRGKRTKRKVEDISEEFFKIVTDPLLDGGEYALALVSVKDRSGCKIFLKEEAKVDVRQQRPRASFGELEGKRFTLTLEERKVALPLRLTGEAPFTLSYRNSDDPARTVHTRSLSYNNDFLEVDKEGTYELMDIQDAECPGSVEQLADNFEVKWIERPKIQLAQGSMVEARDDRYVKKEVCEGDEDAIEVTLAGSPPYNVKYEQRLKPDRGTTSLGNKEFTAGLGVASIRMETSQAGLVQYRFSELGDYLYDHDPRKHSPLVLEQRVHPKPSARFSVPGKTYKYCKDEGLNDEAIAITFEGVPPFYLELGIKHQGSARPELVRIPNIPSNTYSFRIPPRVLTLGNHIVSIRKVRDSRGCTRKTETDAPHVPVNVADAPTILPLEARIDYCVGDRIAYTLSGSPPFAVFYNFEGIDRKATTSTTNFRRLAEKPGNFTITALVDGTADCKARTKLTKLIHPMPSVRISKGQDTVVDIHEGGEAEILFEFSGTPPFEWTYTRSENPRGKNNKRSGGRGKVLETKHDVSYEHTKSVRTSEEGVYEVVAIKDRYCSFSTMGTGGGRKGQGGGVYGGGSGAGAIGAGKGEQKRVEL
ncbi:MAG: hypothetical protein M1833_005080 [Piccolia ochrophora]|nr:MAG: hypothetical protein M1833_005080 [Piccolia ochrophora]